VNATYTADQGIAALELAIRLNHDIATEQFYDQGGTRQKLRDAHARLYAIADQFFLSHTGFESFDAVLAAAGAQHAYTPTFHEDYGNDRVHAFLAQAFDYAAELTGLKVRAYRPERSPSSQSGILGLPPFPKGPLTSELVRVASQTADLVRNGAIEQAVSYAEAQHLSAKASQLPDRHVEFLKRIEDGAKRLLKHPGYWEFTFTDANGEIVERLVIHESERAEFLKAADDGKVEWLANPAIVCRERGWPWGGHCVAGQRFWKRCPTVQEGDSWSEHINQGDRHGEVVAVDEERGQYLWEYEMPKGTTGLVLYGWKQGRRTRRVVSYNSLSDRWLRLLAGFNGLIGNPQGGAREFQARWRAFCEAVS
jgi:hypothetical protein